MAPNLWPFFSCVGKGTSRLMGQMVAWRESADHCASRTMVGSEKGCPNKIVNRVRAVNDIGLLLFWYNA